MTERKRIVKNMEKTALEKMADAIENEDIDFPTFKYKCNKCNRDAEWSIIIGLPMKEMPCGCGGLLILQR